MALVVFDRGARIETPVSGLFPTRRIEHNAAVSSEPAIPSTDNNVRNEAEHLTQEYQRFNELKKAHSQAAHAYKSQSPEQDEPDEPVVTASQIMSSPVFTVVLEASLKECLQTMDQRGINHLLVVNNEESIVGLVSRIDILRHQLNAGARVEDVYRNQFLVATPETDVKQIAANLITYHIGSVPVISDEDEALGIITRTDLIKLLISSAQVEKWV